MGLRSLLHHSILQIAPWQEFYFKFIYELFCRNKLCEPCPELTLSFMRDMDLYTSSIFPWKKALFLRELGFSWGSPGSLLTVPGQAVGCHDAHCADVPPSFAALAWQWKIYFKIMDLCICSNRFLSPDI